MTEPKFILTRELGKLTRWLRILGYDTVYYKENDYDKLILQGLTEERMILSRSKHIGHARIKIIYLKSEDLKEQLLQLQREVKIIVKEESLFSRCTICNEKLASVSKEKVKNKIPDYIYQTQDTFWICPICKRIYWTGSHWGNVKEVVSLLISTSQGTN